MNGRSDVRFSEDFIFFVRCPPFPRDSNDHLGGKSPTL